MQNFDKLMILFTIDQSEVKRVFFIWCDKHDKNNLLWKVD